MTRWRHPERTTYIFEGFAHLVRSLMHPWAGGGHGSIFLHLFLNLLSILSQATLSHGLSRATDDMFKVCQLLHLKTMLLATAPGIVTPFAELHSQ